VRSVVEANCYGVAVVEGGGGPRGRADKKVVAARQGRRSVLFVPWSTLLLVLPAKRARRWSETREASTKDDDDLFLFAGRGRVFELRDGGEGGRVSLRLFLSPLPLARVWSFRPLGGRISDDGTPSSGSGLWHSCSTLSSLRGSGGFGGFCATGGGGDLTHVSCRVTALRGVEDWGACFVFVFCASQ